MNLAGEPLPYPLVQDLYERSTIEKVFNLYGPSEDTTYSTYLELEKGVMYRYHQLVTNLQYRSICIEC